MSDATTRQTTEVRLFGFHHAGGSSSLYQGWDRLLPSGWELRALDAPGHGKLMGQRPLDDFDDLMEFFAGVVRPELTVPYALFGHSMGGVVAYELAHRLVEQGCAPPVWVGVSACRAPGSPLPVQRHLISDEELRRHIGDLGGTPRQLLDDPDLWGLFAPLIRADLRFVETWRSPADRRLSVPLSVFGGTEDAHASPERLAAWAVHSDTFLGTRLFDGGHFYLADDPRPVLDRLVQDVRLALDAAAQRVG